MQSIKTPTKKTTSRSIMLEKAKRAKSARQFAGLTREEMNLRHHIPPSTLRGWETPGLSRSQGLTQKGAERLSTALQKEGVICSIEWLMEGIGLGPQFLSTTTESAKKSKVKSSPWSQHLAIQNEIRCFEENNPEPIITIITDNGLSPFYQQGEYVGGTKKYLKDIALLVDTYCIVETAEQGVFVRKLCHGKKANTFSLVSLNGQDTVEDEALSNVKLNWAATIVWHRKPD